MYKDTISKLGRPSLVLTFIEKILLTRTTFVPDGNILVRLLNKTIKVCINQKLETKYML